MRTKIVAFILLGIFVGCNDIEKSLNDVPVPVIDKKETVDTLEMRFSKVFETDATKYGFYMGQDDQFYLYNNNIIKYSKTFDNFDSVRFSFPIQYVYRIYLTSSKDFLLITHNGLNHFLYKLYRKTGVCKKIDSFRPTQVLDISSLGQRVYVTSMRHDESASFIQRSEDEGETWTIVAPSGWETHYYNCRTHSDESIYATQINYNVSALMISKDYGNSWIKKTIPAKTKWGFYGLKVMQNRSIAVSNEDGVYISNSEYSDWRLVLKEPLNTYPNYDYHLLKNYDNKLVALRISGFWDLYISNIFISGNNGISWKTYKSNIEKVLVKAYWEKDGYIYLSTIDKSSEKNIIYRSEISLSGMIEK